MASLSLPPQVHVFVRDWLSANHVLLKSNDGHVLIDSGYSRHADFTLSLIDSADGLAGAPLARLINTHCHSDHMGGNALIAAHHACPIALPVGETAAVDAWDDKGLLLGYCDQRADRFAYQEVIRPGDVNVWGDLEWHALAAPGHDMGALVFYNPEHRVLISGDALWQNGFGFVMPREIDPHALPATRATLAMLAALDIRTVIPGHGEPFAEDEVPAALERAFGRIAHFENDSVRVARHALKVILMFALLDRQSLAVDALPDYVSSVGLYRDFNAMFFHLEPAVLAQSLLDDLLRAGAVSVADGSVRPR